MSRGGRGGGRGGRRGPDLSWDDEQSSPGTSVSKKPEPLFPKVQLPIPKPLEPNELAAVKRYLHIRDRIRNGPLYSVLDPSSRTDERGKVDKRAGFDPFTDQEKYSTKYHKRRRTMPDLSGRDYALKYFPQELWSTLDPQRTHPLWQTIETERAAKPRKRKRALAGAMDEEEGDKNPGSGSESDVVVTGRRKPPKKPATRRDQKTMKQAKQKRGLDAEDDYPDIDQNEDDDGDVEDAPQDSEYDESDDGGGDDYNAEQYFEGGDEEEDEGGGGDDEPSY